MRKALLYLFFILIALNSSVTAQLYTFRNFNHKDGLSLANITAIHASKDGNIWLGTDGAGLIRFNGKQFVEIENKGEQHHISSICERNNQIFFASRYKGVYHTDGTHHKLIIKNQDFTGDLKFLKALRDSMFVIATDRSIYLYHSKKVHKLITKSDALSITKVIELNNALLIFSNQGNFHLSLSSKRITTLNNWLKSKNPLIQQMSFGYLNGQELMLYDNRLQNQLNIVLNSKGEIFSIVPINSASPLNQDEHIISSFYDFHYGKAVHLTSQNNLFLSRNQKHNKIAKNYHHELSQCHAVITDKNSDIWMISSQNGLYKVSLEPFTRLMLDPLYSSPDIFSMFKSSDGTVMLSTGKGETHIGSLAPAVRNFERYAYRTYTYVENNSSIFLGTSNGIHVFDKKTKALSRNTYTQLGNQRISHLQLINDILYIGVHDKGLFRYDIKLDKLLSSSPDKNLPNFIYTSQYDPSSQKIFYGTNSGVYVEELLTKKTYKLSKSSQNGYYVGVSIKDIFGTIWFTGEKGLFGILQNGEEIFINDSNYFNSKLFYTLNSDNYGNLIIGTNKGLTILQVNEQGKVLNFDAYTGQTGFSGYETHMRSQFQDEHSILIGTIEGLFSINMDVLRNFPQPTPPVITSILHQNETEQLNSFAFEFFTNNPKIAHLRYTYRIKGYKEEWSDLSSISKIYLSNLPNGDFVLEVRSTYDGKIYSESGTYPFKVILPFWKTRWFIVLLFVLIVVANLIIILKRRTFDGGNFFRSKDILVELNMTPSILLFAFLADIISNYVAPIVDPEIPSQHGTTFTSGFILLAIYLLANNAKRLGNSHLYRPYLILGYSVILLHYISGAFFTNLHPFYIVAMAMIMTMAPYVFDRIRHVIIQSLIVLTLSCVFALYLEDTLYNKYLFLFMVMIASFLSIFTIYLRYDSLEKLIFISGVVNKGNVQVIAFNEEGTITYVSENINEIIPIQHDELLNQKISALNRFLPDEGDYRTIDLTRQFYDGQKYLAPMISTNGDLKWVEWSCKVFSNNVNIILGQNVSDRMELENTYELLVENAEDLIYQCEVNGNFQFLNNRCYEILEYSKEELEGKSAIDIVQIDYREMVSNHYRDHFLERKSSSYFEFPIVAKNGHVIWVGQHVTTLFKQGNKKHINGFLALARDITQKREQQQIIEEQRDDITASITYAKRIQMNLLPPSNLFEQQFYQSFILYRPKDIVSGDFYWLKNINGKTVVALADCTGHGVPGAFMTLLGINILNSIVLENGITEPSQILNDLDKKLIQILPDQNGTELYNDGMELTVCTIDNATGALSYACAGSRFLIYENKGFNMYKGDIKHIGDKLPDFRGYVSHSVQLEKDSTVYLFTDGFQDQFGGIKNKKFSFRRLLEIVEANIRLPLSEQQIMIEEEFDSWKKDVEQTDDVTILAFRKISEK